MTVHDDDFFADLAMFREAPVPPAGPELRSLFAAVATIPAAEPARRLPVYKRVLTGLPSKIAAGALGALLAGSVGAGALTGTMVLTSDDDDVPVAACVDEVSFEDADADAGAGAGADDVADDGVADEAPVCEGESAADEAADESAEEESDGDESDAGAAEEEVVEEEAAEEEAAEEEAAEEAPVAAAPVDLASVPVPTSQSEAAQTHAFDEACGNHGAYVSYFAQTGEEPACATAARAAADGTEAPAGDEAGDEAADSDKAEVRAERKAAKADAKGERKAAKPKSSTNKSDKGGR